MNSTEQFDVAIAGGGPAGSSAAIRLALTGRRVLLVEEKKFPRPKLCGEFISPECLTHFEELGVLEQMLAAGASELHETVFYSTRGRKLAVPSAWFKFSSAALGLSRSEMDYQLLDRAKTAGALVLENSHVADLICDAHRGASGIKVKIIKDIVEYRATLTLDATGRNRFLARRFDGADRLPHKRGLVAFKAHFENASVAPGACEIYFYQRGYGGLSSIEDGISNLCFIVSAEDVRRHSSNPDDVMRNVVMQNARAAKTLEHARLCSPWLSVSLEGFGRKAVAPVAGMFAIGDAASFIDPFTGSGMLMAMESGQVAAQAIMRGGDVREIANRYRNEYASRFNARLRIASTLRRAAFIPYLADAAIFFFGLSPQFRRKVARATRHSRGEQAASN